MQSVAGMKKRCFNYFMNIFENINRLTAYGLKTGLIEEEDAVFVKNQLLMNLSLDGFDEASPSGELPDVTEGDLENILSEILDYACEKGLVENSVAYRDLFDTKLMATMVSKPSEISKKFWSLFKESPKKATDFFYKFSQDTDYIRRYRVCKDLKWKAETEFGDLDITINLSKPEKDPKAIAAAKNMKQSGYPLCLLCKENVGYAGRVNHAARGNHRIIALDLAGETWGFQYSPYVYYNEHCIVFNYEHTPMKISRKTFSRLLDFVKKFPHYILGSNADLPIVGGSILTHDHFQGGAYEFPMAKAPYERMLVIDGFKDVECGIIKWPMSVIRIASKDPERLVELSDRILQKWRGYTDEKAFIFAETDGEKHNTLNPIARFRNGRYEMDLVLRNNITTEEHPLGVYHPHAELHHIKKENIGLIEVMGLAILPGRLKSELSELENAIVEGKDIRSIESIAKHADWIDEVRAKNPKIDRDNVGEILKREVGLVFSKVLSHAGVFKCDAEGREAFRRFTDII